MADMVIDIKSFKLKLPASIEAYLKSEIDTNF